ncbi:hypothetical protein B484DRAFT_394144 [Ochromonadaceae sp. CCMP2298]|nr:hypothetical protein B484DRAFT_394144 [Ochromonadaceae sp. CCMP2298]
MCAAQSDASFYHIPASPTPTPAPASVPTSASAGTQPLESFTAEEVQALIQGEGMENLMQPFKQNKITDELLSCYEEYADLMEPGVGVVGKVQARALMARIKKWNESGVPF